MLIYCDPPYCSGRDYSLKQNQNSKIIFTDKWSEGIDEYLSWLTPKLKEMIRILADQGVLLLHVDWHVSHRIKLLLDTLLGTENFICEFIWRMFSPHLSKGLHSPAKNHQSILVYAKTPRQFKYFPQFVPYREYYKRRARKDKDGRLWVDQYLGALKEETITKLKQENRVFTTRNGHLRRKQFLDEMKGEPVGTVITHIDRLNSQSKERTGLETQKPEALLDLFINMFTEPQDYVADFFSGSGTLPAVATNAHRYWIASELNPEAFSLIKTRLKQK